MAALCGVALLFVMLAGEIVVRLADLRLSQVTSARCTGAGAMLDGQKGLFQLDPAAGYTMRPNTCVRLQSSEYDEVLLTNNRGLPGPDVPASKPAGEFRIVVLGDSYTAGGQVPYDQTFTAVFEQQFHAAGYPNVRVVNAGVGGWTTFNEAGFLRANLDWLQPDLVVVAAYLGNDVAENVLATYGGYRIAPEHPDGMTWGRPAAELLQQSFSWFPRNGVQPSGPIQTRQTYQPGQALPTAVGNAAASTGPPPAPPAAISPLGAARASVHTTWDTIRHTSRLLGRLFGDPIQQASVTTAPGAAPPSKEQKKLSIASFEWTILREVPHTYWLDVAWPLFGRYLADIRASAASVGAPAVLVAIPHMAQFDDQMRARTLADFRFAGDEVDWDRPQRELRVQAEQAGLPMLDLLPVFRARPDRADLYLRLDTHFSALGHRVTAEQLEAFVRSFIGQR